MNSRTYPSLVLCILLFLCIGKSAEAQVDKRYFEFARVADSLYKNKNYADAALYYSDAFKVNNSKGYPVDRYSAACAWTHAGNFDSAFYNLNRIMTYTDYFNFLDISIDSNLIPLHQDSRWQHLIETINENRSKTKLNQPALSQELNKILIDDQKDRGSIQAIREQFGPQSSAYRNLWASIQRSDSANLIAVEKILDKYGWLGADDVGEQGNLALFLAIQHADLTAQQKYLPMLRDAARNKKAKGEYLAMLEDRVAIEEGKMQVYGSQVGIDSATGGYYVLPLQDPDNVDKRRASVGLNTMSAYLSQWKIKWNAEEYKKTIPHP
jgi:hypothetical protein